MKIKNNIKLFKIKNSDFIYFTKSGELYQIEDEIAQKIKKIKDLDEKNLNLSKYSDITFDEFKKLYFKDRTSEYVQNIDYRTYPMKHFMLNVSQKCNLNCIYCYGIDGSYGNSKNMSTDIGFKSVDFMIKQIEKDKNSLLDNTFLEENHL